MKYVGGISSIFWRKYKTQNKYVWGKNEGVTLQTEKYEI